MIEGYHDRARLVLDELRRPPPSTIVDFSAKRRLDRSSNDARWNNVDWPACVSLRVHLEVGS
jgi:hypothetical protein